MQSWGLHGDHAFRDGEGTRGFGAEGGNGQPITRGRVKPMHWNPSPPGGGEGTGMAGLLSAWASTRRVKTILPPWAPASTATPSLNSPLSSASASGRGILRWVGRVAG